MEERNMNRKKKQRLNKKVKSNMEKMRKKMKE